MAMALAALLHMCCGILGCKLAMCAHTYTLSHTKQGIGFGRAAFEELYHSRSV